MMNPFIAALMQQTEQASKDALTDNQLALPVSFGGLFGGLFGGGGQQGGIAGAMGQKPGYAAPPPGYGQTAAPWAPRQPVEVIPYTAPTPAAYNPDPVPEIGFSGTPSGGGVLDAPEPVGGTPAIPPTMPIDAPPLSSDYTTAMTVAPKSAAEIAAEVLAVPAQSEQPADVYEETKLLKQAGGKPSMRFDVPEGLTVPNANFTAQKAAYVPDMPSLAPVTWDTSRAPLAGVDPNVVQAFEEAANAVNAAGGTYVPTLEMWSGADNHSRNHAGHAADIAFLTDQGIALAWNDPWVQDWSVEAARRGMRQLGAGPAYMKRYGDGREPIGGDRIHAGGMTPGYDSNDRVRVWSDSDPEWGSDYAGGITGQQDWLSRLNAAINDPVALGTPIPALEPQAPWWDDAPMGGEKVAVDAVAGFNEPTQVAAAGNFEKLLPLVLEHEGGYSNHWADNGGATNRGVTWQRYNQYRRDKGLPIQDVRYITDDEVNEIYRKYYFDEVRGSELPPGVDYAMFDFAVNSGPSRAIKFAQEILGVPADGKLGPVTMAAIQSANPAELAAALNDKRLNWLQGLDDWQHFGTGWGNRVNDVSQASARFASAAPDTGFGVFSTKAPETTGFSGALQWAGGDDWTNPYDHTNLAIFGGVGSPTDPDGLWHGWNSADRWAHDNDHEDYSQFYREFTYEAKPGYVPVGERDGRTVYAAPAPEYVGGKPVDRNLYVEEARRRGALVPTETEMRALYDQASPVRMPTIPNGGGPNDRISFEDVPEGPWYGPKEFYRTDDSPALPWTFVDAMQNPAILAAILRNNYGG